MFALVIPTLQKFIILTDFNPWIILTIKINNSKMLYIINQHKSREQ